MLELGPLLKAAILGVVEGLTEFLPVSSTGHLILAGSLLDFTGDKVKVFEIAIQTGAIFAIILIYWPRLRDTARGLTTSRQAQRFALNVLVAFLPAVVLGLLFGKGDLDQTIIVSCRGGQDSDCNPSSAAVRTTTATIR